MKAISVDTMRALDAQTIEDYTPGYVLMDRAGRGTCDAMRDFLCWTCAPAWRRRFSVLAGKGNNGGDGYVVARCLAEQGIEVRVYAVCPPDELEGDARAHAVRLPDDVPVEVVEVLPEAALQPGCVVIDALLGTGISGELREPYDQLIAQINAAQVPVVAVDIPSGLNGDTGEIAGDAVTASLTVTMAQPKQGLLINQGPRRCGALRCIDIGIPPQLVRDAEGWMADATFLEDARALVTRRPNDSHKNTFGALLVVGGSAWYSGAPFLAAEGAMRSGAGLVTVAMPRQCQPLCPVGAAQIVRRVPDDDEGFLGPQSVDAVVELLADSDAVVFGPGIGPVQQASAVLKAILEGKSSVLVDADGLRRLAENPELTDSEHAPLVLTPHPGEMRVLLEGYRLDEAKQGDRFQQARSLAEATDAVVVLKGVQTVVAAPDGRLAVNTSGTPALATAGTGDVLSGMIGALLAQGMDPWDAARLGSFVHGFGAEQFALAHRSFTADDLAARLAQAWRHVSSAS